MSNTYCVVVFCLACLRLVYCVPNVASFSGLSILHCPFSFSNIYLQQYYIEYLFVLDITYSRHRKDAFCDSLTGCKCNRAMCFYGDPCLCDSKRDGCPENKFLEENGGKYC